MAAQALEEAAVEAGYEVKIETQGAYPASPLPENAQPLFDEMQAFLNETADRVVSMLSDRDTQASWVSAGRGAGFHSR